MICERCDRQEATHKVGGMYLCDRCNKKYPITDEVCGDGIVKRRKSGL